MSEYHRPSQGSMRGGVPMIYTGTEVDRLLAPKVNTPRRRFSLPDGLTEQLLDPINRTLVAGLLLGGSVVAWLEMSPTTSTSTANRQPETPALTKPVDKTVKAPRVVRDSNGRASMIVSPGDTVEVGEGGIVEGDIAVLVNGRIIPTFDNDSKSGEVTIVDSDKPSQIQFPYGGKIEFASVQDRNQLVQRKVENMQKSGCVEGCDRVRIRTVSSLTQQQPSFPLK